MYCYIWRRGEGERDREERKEKGDREGGERKKRESEGRDEQWKWIEEEKGESNIRN